MTCFSPLEGDCHELTAGVDPLFSSRAVPHEGNGKQVKIPSRFFPENTDHFPITSLRNFLNKPA
jgi:hypothetical protein